MLTRKEDGNVMSLRDICSIDDMPAEGTLYRWLSENPEFGEMYARAREERAHLAAEDIIHIADTEQDPNKARVRIDARKWYASKLNRKDYGDSLDLGGGLHVKLTDDQLESRLAHILGKAGVALALGREGASEETP
jgi:hypothetical protein